MAALSGRDVMTRWHDGNLSCCSGDSAHTAHFSIGHGTKLALEDAIALADSLQRADNVQQALRAYQTQRQQEIARPLNEARCSAQWFESLPRYTALKPPQFATLIMLRRSPLVRVLPCLLLQPTAPCHPAIRCPRRVSRPPGSGSEGPVRHGAEETVRPNLDGFSTNGVSTNSVRQ